LSILLKKYPSFTFLKYFKKGKINISNPKFCEKLNELLKSNKYSLQVWKDFFKMKVLLSVSSYLSEEVENIYFNFFSKILSGTPRMKPLWKRSLNIIESKLGFLLGKSFVSKYFNEKSKSNALEIIKYLKLDLHNRIKTLNWMDDLTKTKALEKLDNMGIKVGYPDKWREYNVDIKKENSYFKNIILCNIDDSDFIFSRVLTKHIDDSPKFDASIFEYFSLSIDKNDGLFRYVSIATSNAASSLTQIPASIALFDI
jgi:predicted metalloendopeptidase